MSEVRAFVRGGRAENARCVEQLGFGGWLDAVSNGEEETEFSTGLVDDPGLFEGVR